MKKILLTIFSILPLAAVAQQPKPNDLAEGAYISVSGGYSDLSLEKFSTQTYTKFDDKGLSFKASLGYQYNQNIATEIAYSNFGKSKVTNDDGNVENKVSAYSIGAKLYPTLDSIAKPFVKIGAAYLSDKESDTVKKSKTNALYGVGVDFVLSRKVRLGVEYELYGKVGTTDSTSTTEPAQVKPKVGYVTLTTSF